MCNLIRWKVFTLDGKWDLMDRVIEDDSSSSVFDFLAVQLMLPVPYYPFVTLGLHFQVLDGPN